MRNEMMFVAVLRRAAILIAGLLIFALASMPMIADPAQAVGSRKTRERILYSFQNGPDGALPQSPLIADQAGNLYGTSPGAAGDGKCDTGCGAVFELSPPSTRGGRWTFAVLHTFGKVPDGGFPWAGLIFGGAGKLYGTTNIGGAFNQGTVFELTPPSDPGGVWTEKVLYSFRALDDGAVPIAGLLRDRKGNLYGTTAEAGSYGGGTIFQLSPPPKAGVPWSETSLHSFGSGTDGWWPAAALIADKSGNLYGTTEWGGFSTFYCGSGCGTVFQLAPPASKGAAWTETVIHEFKGGVPGDGASPLSALVVDPAGNLYGTTSVSQDGGGTVFQLAPPVSKGGTWTETVLYRFPQYAADADYPQAGVIFDKSGDLFGTTEVGGGHAEMGAVFRLTRPAALSGVWTDTILHSFIQHNSDGEYPYAAVVFGKDGLLYGTTTFGGTGTCPDVITGCGTVFSIAP
jgi:uncharacterized repeat protein (TIGR03803 family)